MGQRRAGLAAAAAAAAATTALLLLLPLASCLAQLEDSSEFALHDPARQAPPDDTGAAVTGGAEEAAQAAQSPELWGWADPSAAALAWAPVPEQVMESVEGVDAVHIIFSSHLDVGFTAVDSEVINTWFHEHFPKAIKVAQDLRDRGGKERLVFMTHSWLVALYLDCPTHIGIDCPNSTHAFEAAVRRGDIYWHALPHVAQVELFDRDLLEMAVQLTHGLDDRFRLPHKQTMNQRDVPGLTRASIPILSGQGVKALTVGVNGVTAPPAVPFNQPFWWRDKPSGTQLLSFWHPGGYSGLPVDSTRECVAAEGFSQRLCLSWTNDNAGPPSAEHVLLVYAQVRKQFPGANVFASTFDSFVDELFKEAPRLDLPVVTQEIGDTWIHGVGSDPGKVAEYRALLRYRQGAKLRYSAATLAPFDRLLLKIPEHTWSVSIADYLGDQYNYANAGFRQELGNNTNYKHTVYSWMRQRSYIDWAVQALGDSQAVEEAQAVVDAVRSGNRPPNPGSPLSGFLEADLSQPLLFSSSNWQLLLDRQSGAIIGLEALQQQQQQLARHSGRKAGKRGGGGSSLASPSSPLAQVVYSTYSSDNFSDFYQDYHYSDNFGWFENDFGKANLNDAVRIDETPRLEAVWHRQSADDGLHIILKSRFVDVLFEEAGAPHVVWTDIHAPPGSQELRVTVWWENKTPTRLPEALWVRWRPDPAAVDPSSWAMHKLGQPISPLEVILNGSRALHAVGDDGVSVRSSDGGGRLRIMSLDAVLVSPGEPYPIPVLSKQPDLQQGMAFCLSNNIWGTNYPQWLPYQPEDADMRFRFVLVLERDAALGGAETRTDHDDGGGAGLQDATAYEAASHSGAAWAAEAQAQAQVGPRGTAAQGEGGWLGRAGTSLSRYLRRRDVRNLMLITFLAYAMLWALSRRPRGRGRPSLLLRHSGSGLLRPAASLRAPHSETLGASSSHAVPGSSSCMARGASPKQPAL